MSRPEWNEVEGSSLIFVQRKTVSLKFEPSERFSDSICKFDPEQVVGNGEYTRIADDFVQFTTGSSPSPVNGWPQCPSSKSQTPEILPFSNAS